MHAHAVDYSASWSAGFRVDLRIDSVYLKLGLFYEKGSRFRTGAIYSGMDLLAPIDIDPSQVGGYRNQGDLPVSFTPEEWTVVVRTPAKLHAGWAGGSPRSVLAFFEYSRIFINDVQEGFRDINEISGSLAVNPTRRMKVSVGFLSTEGSIAYWGGYPYGFDDAGSILFLTAGLTLRFRYFETDLAFAGSSNSTTFKWFRQTVVKLGLNSHL